MVVEGKCCIKKTYHPFQVFFPQIILSRHDVQMQIYGGENLLHIICVKIFAKNYHILGQKWVSLPLFSILSAQDIIIVHLSWFTNKKSPES